MARIIDFADGFTSENVPNNVPIDKSDVDGLEATLNDHETRLNTAEPAITALQTNKADQSSLDSTDTILSNHIADLVNPHNVTAAQVGNDTAQWNANAINSIPVSSTPLAEGQALIYDGVEFVPGNAGGGSGQGAKSYFSDYNTEDISKLVAFGAYAETPPVMNAGVGSVGLTTSLDTSNSISKTAYKISKDADDRLGFGFAVDTDVLFEGVVSSGKPLIVQLNYKNSANYASGDIEAWYFFPDSALNTDVHRLTGINGLGERTNALAKATGTIGQHTAQIQVPTDATKVRVGFFVATDRLPAYDLSIGRLFIGEASVVNLPVQFDDKAFTPVVSLTTNVTNTGLLSRKGNKASFLLKTLFTGANTQGQYTVKVPNGLTIDTAGLTTTTAANYLLGRAQYTDSGSNQYLALVYYIDAQTLGVRMLRAGSAAPSLIDGPVINTNTGYPAVVAVNDYIEMFVDDLPILQWKDQTNTMTDVQVDVQNDGFRASKTSAQSIPASSWTTITNYNTISFNKLGSFDSVTGAFTAKRKGNVSFTAKSSFVPNATGLRYIRVRKGASTIASSAGLASSAEELSFTLSDSIDVVVGDTLTLEVFQSSGAALNTGVNYGCGFSANYEADSSAIASLAGPRDREETIITTETSTTTADAWVDVTGSSFAVPAGKARIGYAVGLYTQNNSASTAGIYGNVALFDSSNNAVTSTIAVNLHVLEATRQRIQTVTKDTVVNNSEPKTYKLRIRCDKATAAGVARISGNNVTALLTDPDQTNIVYWESF